MHSEPLVAAQPPEATLDAPPSPAPVDATLEEDIPHSSPSAEPSLPADASVKGRPRANTEEQSADDEQSLLRPRNRADFEWGEILGEGSFSTVVHGREPATNRQYAVKILEISRVVRYDKVRYVYVEKQALKILQHPFIIRLYYTFKDRESLYFVLELGEKGDLLQFIKSVGVFDMDTARFYTAEIVTAVEYIHSCNILHRDLKPENIVLDGKGHIRITDFGCAKILENDPTADPEGSTLKKKRSFVGTSEYCSPELLLDQPIAWPCDVWAIGCMLYQMLAGRPPFKGANEYLTLQKVQNLEYSFPSDFPEVARDLVQLILTLDADERYTIPQIKAHPFFDGFDWTDLHLQTPPVPLPREVPVYFDSLEAIAQRLPTAVAEQGGAECVYNDGYSDSEAGWPDAEASDVMPIFFHEPIALSRKANASVDESSILSETHLNLYRDDDRPHPIGVPTIVDCSETDTQSMVSHNHGMSGTLGRTGNRNQSEHNPPANVDLRKQSIIKQAESNGEDTDSGTNSPKSRNDSRDSSSPDLYGTPSNRRLSRNEHNIAMDFSRDALVTQFMAKNKLGYSVGDSARDIASSGDIRDSSYSIESATTSPSSALASEFYNDRAAMAMATLPRWSADMGTRDMGARDMSPRDQGMRLPGEVVFEYNEKGAQKRWNLREMFPGDRILKHGLVTRKKTFFSKHRLLVLTNKRLLVVDPAQATVRDEVVLKDEFSIELKNARRFTITMQKKAWVFDDRTGGASDWVDSINSARP
ncbi:kinase-like domain-containing protein [Polychytrium aggregatum]|uniref:kinase-like domain-containing protein n=1 Tax=Polychytrium aggregatum TaxID=110093 RepID=UPI0022FDD448|nr:kinase-like domain-containing protein [Polychytrium aggregatum]KAI9209428.1 kinase-like domain-containing protein [Polychytrium aggregatum]